MKRTKQEKEWLWDGSDRTDALLLNNIYVQCPCCNNEHSIDVSPIKDGKTDTKGRWTNLYGGYCQETQQNLEVSVIWTDTDKEEYYDIDDDLCIYCGGYPGECNCEDYLP